MDMRGWMWSEMDGYGYAWEWMGADGQDRYACVCMIQNMHRSYRRMGINKDGYAWMCVDGCGRI